MSPQTSPEPFDHSSLTVPVVQAPMAGGPTTPELTAAVSTVGGLGMLAAGYRTAAEMLEQIARTRELTRRPFGVNLFVPARDVAPDLPALAAYRAELQPEALARGVNLPDPLPMDDTDDWDAKIEALLNLRVPIQAVSFTFGLPDAEVVAALHSTGACLIGTVTDESEAEATAATGLDVLFLQGTLAGGHRATHDPAAEPDERPLLELVAAVRRRVRLPIVAGGGLGTAREVHGVLSAGARAVLIGTALLCADEAGTSAVHRQSLGDPRFDETVLTRAFTGRPARALRNRFTDVHGETAPRSYPFVHHLTKPLRAAAAAAGDPEAVHLWAGVGYRHARRAPAADIVAGLIAFE
ncbi:nitronate monooxygenase [Streptacidiphilus sp. MAP12-20]|uniref:nitronate monooxygenase n=1 Tax=Streptacidiphilus sp. MAP12-20 TaxID=3156299 RepID=UPI0035139569